MRIALLTEGGYPYARGESVVWCDRLVRGLSGHEFEVYALSRGRRQEEAGWLGARALPAQVRRVRTAPLWGEPPGAEGAGEERAFHGAAADRFARHFRTLAEALCMPAPEFQVPDSASRTQADRFSDALYGLADLAAEHPGLSLALRSEEAVQILESAARAPGASRSARAARVGDLLAVTERLERALRVLCLDWYGPGRYGPAEGQRSSAGGTERGLAGVDLCHAVGAGLAALPGLLAKRAFGTPLLITEHGVRLREHYLEGLAALTAGGRGTAGTGVRALLASFQRQLAGEAYRQADVITPGSTQTRSWQQRCGADRRRLRTVYPGMDATPFVRVEEDRGVREPAPTLVWVGALQPAQDVSTLLHAFAAVRERLPQARLLMVQTRAVTRVERKNAEGGADHAAECRELAARLFPAVPQSADTREARLPVVFAELGGPQAPTLADVYAHASVVVSSSAVEGFPLSLVEAMFCGRATVSTEAGAVPEVIGGTGLVVPPGDPAALADACLSLLTDPERRARLGAAARARALELFTVEQNVTAFHGIYLELFSHRTSALAAPGASLEEAEVKPFMKTAESQLAGAWADSRRSGAPRASVPPRWARTTRQDDTDPPCPVTAGVHGGGR